MAKKTKPRSSRKILKKKKGVPGGNFSGRASVPPGTMLQNAYSLLHQGKRPEAEHLLNTLLNSTIEDPAVLNQLGVLAHLLGKTGIGLGLLRKSVDLQATAPFYNNLGLVQEQAGDADNARRSYERALELDAGFAPAHYNLGNVLQNTLQLEGAIEHYRLACRHKPDYAAAYNNMANAQKRLGALEEAKKSCLKALQIDPNSAEAISTWCNVMIQTEAPEKVIGLCDKAIGFVQKKDLIYGTLGDLFADLGNKDDALTAYREALQYSKKPGKIHLRMSMLKKYRKEDDDLLALENAYTHLSGTGNRDFVCFALGKAYEDTEDYHKAFRCIDEGNDLVRATYSYSITEDRIFFEELKKSFNADFLAKESGSGHRDPTPVFIVGMPRSGTTLVEQILASHSRVFGAGELHELDRIYRKSLQQNGIQGFPGGITRLPPHLYENLGAEYSSFIQNFDKTAARVVDKMPQNFLWVGLLHLILPEARIIHCKRDPMDTCWSIYKNIFDVPHKYAQNQVELGQYYKLYQDLMEHWKKIMPHKIYELEYETLIQEQEDETRKLIEHCGLPWEESCLDFHRSERRVLTSSMAQVRKPIYSSSVKKWQQFEKELQPLYETLNR